MANKSNTASTQFTSIQANELQVFLQQYGAKTSPADFYRDVFPAGALADAEKKESGKYTAHVFGKGGWNRYVNDDLTGVLDTSSQTSLKMNCIAYAGRGDSPEKARELYALIFRIYLPDEYYEHYIRHKLESLTDGWGNQPKCPTYILTDHKYQHIYFCYVLSKPIPMYHRLHKKLQVLSDELSRVIHRMWDFGGYSSFAGCYIYEYECRKPSPKSIFEQYPVVGSQYNGGEVCAYKIGTGKKYTLDDLNSIVPKASQVVLYKPKMTLEEAKEEHPKWYSRRFEQHRKKAEKRTYDMKRQMYDWYIREVGANMETVEAGALEGLASCAVKCGVNEDDFLDDLAVMSGMLSARFEEADIMEHAERAEYFYKELPFRIRLWTREALCTWSGLQIEPAKRNHRTQKEHLKIVHESQSREKDILAWVKDHPGETQARCSEDLGVSRKTVSKWWPREEPPKVVKVKNPCPLCGAEMKKIRFEPRYSPRTGKYYTHTDKECPVCGLYIDGRDYVCKGPTR